MLTTNEIRALIDRGERPAARQHLMQLARAGGASTPGEIWWLLAKTLDDPAQQADCLARAQAAGYVPPPVAPPAAAPPPAEEPPVFAWEQPGAAPARSSFEPARPAAPAPVEPPVFAWEQPDAAPARSSFEPARPAAPAPIKPAKARRTERQDRAAAPPRYPPEQIEFVIGEFGKHENRYEITQKAMGYYGLAYDDAQKLIDYVESAHSTTIARKQLPLIMVLSIAGIIGGAYLILSALGLVPGRVFTLALVSPRFLVRIGTGLSTMGGGLVGLIYGIMALRGKR
jgi:hypothetical protein